MVKRKSTGQLWAPQDSRSSPVSATVDPAVPRSASPAHDVRLFTFIMASTVASSSARNLDIISEEEPFDIVTKPTHKGVATWWTGVDTATPLFSDGVSGIESLWSVLIYFRLYPQTLYHPDLGRDNPSPNPSILSTPLCLTWRRPCRLKTFLSAGAKRLDGNGASKVT